MREIFPTQSSPVNAQLAALPCCNVDGVIDI
jgi:hypothetical protein